VQGRPTGEPDIATTTEAILAGLALDGSETVLDICCGNGMISQRIAAHCKRLIGVDYSAPLTQLAARRYPASNIRYVTSDALQLDAAAIGAVAIDAAFMSFAFQYFDADRATILLRRLKSIASRSFRLFLEGVPDKDRLFCFYNTPERAAEYHRRKADGTEAIGEWWDARSLIEVSEAEGYTCRPIAQDPSRVNAHYRFDALLRLE
jgi:cyclopropane fatty-acyl-phospholipid synthase-like methyltransferase